MAFEDFPYGLVGAMLLVGFALASRIAAARRARARARSGEADSFSDQPITEDEDLYAQISQLVHEKACLEEELSLLRDMVDKKDAGRNQNPDVAMDIYRKVLGMPESGQMASEDLKKAYRAAIKKSHPDQGGDETYMRLVVEAYDYLKVRT